MNTVSAITHLDYPSLAPASPEKSEEITVPPSYRYGKTICTSTVHGRIHQVHALSERLKCFSSSEVLLAILLADLYDKTNHKTVDSSGVAYLSGLVLAGMIARQVGTIPVSNYRPIPKETMPPAGTRLDVRV